MLRKRFGVMSWTEGKIQTSVDAKVTNMEELAHLQLPADARKIFQLAPPGDYRAWSSAERKACGQALSGAISRLLRIEWSSSEWKAMTESCTGKPLAPERMFDRLLGSLFEHHFALAVAETESGGGLGSVLTERDHEWVEEIAPRLRDKPDASLLTRASGMSFLRNYDAFVACRAVIRTRMMSLGWAMTALEVVTHETLTEAIKYSTFPGLSSSAHWMAVKGSELLTQIYQERADAKGRDHQPGAFSSIRVDELEPLAERTEAISDRYGRKQVEKIFEQQLALLFQSFGFLVVQTRTGTSTVDLLCISSSDRRASIVVEAKTSRKHYALPERDSRALRDYVRDVQNQLRTLPPLRLVLIIGPRPARTMTDKVKALEGHLNLPVRYLHVSILVALREAMPGPLVGFGLLDDLVAAERVPDDRLPEELRKRFQGTQAAHTRFTHELTDLWTGPTAFSNRTD